MNTTAISATTIRPNVRGLRPVDDHEREMAAESRTAHTPDPAAMAIVIGAVVLLDGLVLLGLWLVLR